MLKVLNGLRVVDLTILLQGSLATMQLALLGAEVIKVEHPNSGDRARGSRAAHGVSLELPAGKTLMFEMANRDKKSMALNPGTQQGKEAIYRLIEISDIFVSNLRPGVLAKLGLDYECLSRLNPRLIYGLGSGFGPDGPDGDAPCMDLLGCARSGFLFNQAAAGDPPIYMVGGLLDQLSATMLAYGLVTAVLERQQTGVGQLVVSSQLNSMIWMQYLPVAAALNMGQELERFDFSDVNNPLFNMYQCADLRWIALGHVASSRAWGRFCDVMGLGELEHDARFSDDRKRADNRIELIAILRKAFAAKPSAEWREVLASNGMHFAIANRVSDLAQDPQVIANRYLLELDNGLKVPSMPFRLDGQTPTTASSPEFGQHTEEILLDLCHYSWHEIDSMRAEGAI